MSEKKIKPLTPQEHLFVAKFIESSNGTQSAMDAGFKGTRRSASVYATRMLSSDRICQQIERFRRDVSLASGWNKARVIAEIEKVFQSAIENEEYKTGLSCLTEIAKIINVMPSTKTMEVRHSFESLLDQSSTTKDITPKLPAITIN